MPFADDARRLQSEVFGNAVLEPVGLGAGESNRIGGPPPGSSSVEAQRAHDMQALRCFQVGLLLGYFDAHALQYYVRTIVGRMEYWESLPLAPVRTERMPVQDLVNFLQSAPTLNSPYRVRGYPEQAGHVAFRTAILPIIRLRTVEPQTVTLLDRAAFSDDWDEVEGSLGTGDGTLMADEVPIVEATLGALKYMRAVTSAITTAYDWGEFPHSMLRGEIRDIIRIHVDTQRGSTKGRLTAAARSLVDITLRELPEPAPSVDGGTAGVRDWFAEADWIVEEYDDAINGKQW